MFCPLLKHHRHGHLLLLSLLLIQWIHLIQASSLSSKDSLMANQKASENAPRLAESSLGEMKLHSTQKNRQMQPLSGNADDRVLAKSDVTILPANSKPITEASAPMLASPAAPAAATVAQPSDKTVVASTIDNFADCKTNCHLVARSALVPAEGSAELQITKSTLSDDELDPVTKLLNYEQSERRQTPVPTMALLASADRARQESKASTHLPPTKADLLAMPITVAVESSNEKTVTTSSSEAGVEDIGSKVGGVQTSVQMLNTDNSARAGKETEGSFAQTSATNANVFDAVTAKMSNSDPASSASKSAEILGVEPKVERATEQQETIATAAMPALDPKMDLRKHVSTTGETEPLLEDSYSDDKRPLGNERLVNRAPLGSKMFRPSGSGSLALAVNKTAVYQSLLAKKAYSKYWTAEQKWDDLFKRVMKLQELLKIELLKNHFLKDVEYYADVGLSEPCANDLKFIRQYAENSTNYRWLFHMIDSMGKNEPGMLTGNVANLGHVIQCIKVRAPSQASNHTLEERYFERQTELLGERFRGKYCLASLRPVLPNRPKLVSRFTETFNRSLLMNISYSGQPEEMLEQRARRVDLLWEQRLDAEVIDRSEPYNLDQVPFESEFYQFVIEQRNFMYSLPRFLGVCFPSSCNRDDIRSAIQKAYDSEHQVVDIEFECEVEEKSLWNWFNTSRLLVHILLALVLLISFFASLARYILVDKMQLKRHLSKQSQPSRLASLIDLLDLISMDKCVGILFVKTKRASSVLDPEKLENNRSTTIDALKGFLVLVLVYCQLVFLGCLPVPFMWSKWGDAMFPFYRSFVTQIFLNASIWSEAFYLVSAFLIGAKFLENHRCSMTTGEPARQPDWGSFVTKRYVRLVAPMVGFILMSYVWVVFTNGFVMQDQSGKIMKPCDSFGWTNLLLFHNHQQLNETCLWPSHVSAAFFQLHLLSIPILALLLRALTSACKLPAPGSRSIDSLSIAGYGAFAMMTILALIGLVYPAYQASKNDLIVPFLIDYLDFDNYRHVIEWTVMPTHNHLTSYMLGLALAYILVKRRAKRELRKIIGSEWQGAYITRISSFESLASSSAASSCTQELGHISSGSSNIGQQGAIGSLTMRPSSGPLDSRLQNRASRSKGLACHRALGFISSLICFASFTGSWFWNGLGQPMSSSQTFCYVIITKLAFNLSFSYLFWHYIARRKNCESPWLLTRFLVPIGRMGLTLFYLSWLVTWFDLLSSLYQWHPSHYFIFEKYNETLSIALILSLFAYGIFEGPIKRIQYNKRRLRLRQKLMKSWSSSMRSGESQQQQQQNWPQGFEFLFTTCFDIPKLLLSCETGNYWPPVGDHQSNSIKGANLAEVSMSVGGDGKHIGESSVWQQVSGSLSMAPDSQEQRRSATQAHNHLLNHSIQVNNASGGNSNSTDGARLAANQSSVSEHYKLNAELRANYSFISVGMYEHETNGDNSSQAQSPAESPLPAQAHPKATN